MWQACRSSCSTKHGRLERVSEDSSHSRIDQANFLNRSIGSNCWAKSVISRNQGPTIKNDEMTMVFCRVPCQSRSCAGRRSSSAGFLTRNWAQEVVTCATAALQFIVLEDCLTQWRKCQWFSATRGFRDMSALHGWSYSVFHGQFISSADK